MFTRILTSALFAGFVTGLIAALLQFVFVQPVLLHAELYETGVLVHSTTAGNSAHMELGPFDLQRNALSVLFQALLYTGYGLILVALMAFANQRGLSITPRQGLIWGLAGYITVQFAPAIGLPPELPGTSAAEVSARQIWWFSTVAVTGLALWFIAFGKSWVAWGLAIILLLIPHLIGAPHPDTFQGPTPPELGSLFAGRALGVGMVNWVILGFLAAYFWQSETADTND